MKKVWLVQALHYAECVEYPPTPFNWSDYSLCLYDCSYQNLCSQYRRNRACWQHYHNAIFDQKLLSQTHTCFHWLMLEKLIIIIIFCLIIFSIPSWYSLLPYVDASLSSAPATIGNESGGRFRNIYATCINIPCTPWAMSNHNVQWFFRVWVSIKDTTLAAQTV